MPFSHRFHTNQGHFHVFITGYQVHFLLRERDSLNTAPAVYRNITLNLCGSKVSVMQDKGAAYTLPDGGDMSIWNKSTLYSAQSLVNPTQQQVREQGTSYHILVVEDDSSLANLEADILKAHGYIVAIASNGEMAITALEQALPDLVLLDLDLSGTINGWDVLQMLRTYSVTPVLLTSAESAVNRQIRIRGETRSTLDLLPKPFLMQALLKRVERMLTIAPY